MNTKHKISLLALAFAGLAFAGCTFFKPNPATPAEEQANILAASNTVWTVTATAVSIDLVLNPQHKHEFYVAKTALDAALGTGPTVEAITTIIKSIPALQTPEGRIIATSILLVFQQSSQTYWKPESAPALRAVAQALSSALGYCLEPPKTAVARGAVKAATPSVVPPPTRRNTRSI